MSASAGDDASSTPGIDRREWVGARARLFGTALVVGLPAGVVLTGALAVYFGTLEEAATTAFALGALLLGFGTLGWSGSIFAGRGFEHMQRHLDTGTNWTERDSRRAMTRIAAFGLGVMLVAGLPSAV